MKSDVICIYGKILFQLENNTRARYSSAQKVRAEGIIQSRLNQKMKRTHQYFLWARSWVRKKRILKDLQRVLFLQMQQYYLMYSELPKNRLYRFQMQKSRMIKIDWVQLKSFIIRVSLRRSFLWVEVLLVVPWIKALCVNLIQIIKNRKKE